MCEQCLAQTVLLVQHIIPNYSLVRATATGKHMQPGDYGLVVANDPALIWPMDNSRTGTNAYNRFHKFQRLNGYGVIL